MAIAAVFWQVVPNNNCLSCTHPLYLARARPPAASAPRRMAAADILPVANWSGLAAPRPYAPAFSGIARLGRSCRSPRRRSHLSSLGLVAVRTSGANTGSPALTAVSLASAWRARLS
jgi:hypothetical protein